MGPQLYRRAYCTHNILPRTLGGGPSQCAGRFCLRHVSLWCSGVPLPNPFESMAISLSKIRFLVPVRCSSMLSFGPVWLSGWSRYSPIRPVVCSGCFSCHLLPCGILASGIVVYYTLQRRITPRQSGIVEPYLGKSSHLLRT